MRARILTRPPSLRDLFTYDPNLKMYGETSMSGQISIRANLSSDEILTTLAHEQVHAVLTPQGQFASTRQAISQFAYENSQLLQFSEEFLAETIGRMRMGQRFWPSAKAATDLVFGGKYTVYGGLVPLSPLGVATEAAIGTGCVFVAGDAFGRSMRDVAYP
jgi:hypothetical protein